MKLFGGPGIVEGVANSWPALSRWQASSLQSRLAGRHFRLTHFSYPDYVHTVNDHDYSSGITLAEYLEQGHSSRGFFLFVNEPEEPPRGIKTTDEELSTMDLLREDFLPHPAFSSAPEERHAIMALDGLGSSHGLHIHGPVWQTQVVGRKAWWLLPPEVPGDKTSRAAHSTEFVGAGSLLKNERGAAPIVDGKVYKEPNACAFLKRSPPPPGSRLCVVGPADTVLLPDDMWHGTCALDQHTASVGGWMVDRRWINDA